MNKQSALGPSLSRQFPRAWLIATMIAICFIGGAIGTWLSLRTNNATPVNAQQASASEQIIIDASQLPPEVIGPLKQALSADPQFTTATYSTTESADISFGRLSDTSMALSLPGQVNSDFAETGQLIPANKRYAIELKSVAAQGYKERLLVTLAKTFELSDPAKTWTYLAVGDVIPARDVYTISKRAGYTYPYQKISERTTKPDLTVTNLETTIADGQIYGEGAGMMRFTAPARAIDGLRLAGIDGVNLANNHAMNGGGTKTAEMLSLLDSAGIGHFGVARRNEPISWTTTVKGLKITHLSFNTVPGSIDPTTASPGASRIPLKPWGTLSRSSVSEVQTAIQTAKQASDVVIPWFQWGTEYTHQANDEQRRLGQAAIDAGADVVVGTHPHWTQGVESYKGRLIAYSLGNFVFDQNWSEKTKQSTALSLTFSGNRIIAASLEPAVIENQVQPRWLTPNEALYTSILEDVASHSWLSPTP